MPGTPPGGAKPGVRLRVGLELIAGPRAIKPVGRRSQQGGVVYVRGVGVTGEGPEMVHS